LAVYAKISLDRTSTVLVGVIDNVVYYFKRFCTNGEEKNMPKSSTLEARVAELERGFAELHQRIASGHANANWIDRMKGCVTDHEAFRETMEYGRQYRHSDRPSDELGEES
jgi:hypothetical protein